MKSDEIRRLKKEDISSIKIKREIRVHGQKLSSGQILVPGGFYDDFVVKKEEPGLGLGIAWSELLSYLRHDEEAPFEIELNKTYDTVYIADMYVPAYSPRTRYLSLERVGSILFDDEIIEKHIYEKGYSVMFADVGFNEGCYLYTVNKTGSVSKIKVRTINL